MYSIKITSEDGSVSWLVYGRRYQFTKSKAVFLTECAVKHNTHPRCNLELVKAP